MDYAYMRPADSFAVPEAEREQRVRANDDLCVIDQREHFIRGVLPIAVHGLDDEFRFGVWARVDKSDFEGYVEAWKAGTEESVPPFPGRLTGPGLYILIPLIEQSRHVDIRVITLDIPRQEAITKDNVPVAIDAVIFMRVTKPDFAVINVQDYVRAILQFARSALRDVIGGRTLDEQPLELVRSNVLGRDDAFVEGQGREPVAASRSDDSAIRPSAHPPTWSSEATERLSHVPSFVRGMVKKIYRDYAAERGIAEITPAVMDRARAELGLEGM